jgi:hypothetical protein
MAITLKWHNPISLKDGEPDGLIFKIPNMSDFDGISGVYMFCRIYGNDLVPLYIGKSKNIGTRLTQHIKQSVHLLQSIKNATNGKKVVVIGEFKSKKGQPIIETIKKLEKYLIETAQINGYMLFNSKGTKFPTDTIEFIGYQKAKKVFGKSLLIKKTN